MALPKIDLPLFEVKLYSTGEKVQYRPFTVKEEKVLLMAQESGDNKQMILAMKQIAGNCCPNIDIESIPMFDLEYLMLQLRSKSVNNEITFTVQDEETQEPVELTLDVDNIKVHIPEDHSKKIDISDDMYLMMRYPTLEEVGMFLELVNLDGTEEENNEKAADILYGVMISCIDSVVNGDEVEKLSEYTEEEVQEFVDTLPGGTIESLKKFFETVPQLKYEAKYTNSAGNEKTIKLEGTETFFL
jgi:hypothetical protein